MFHAIGVLEFKSIVKGVETADKMVKVSDVELVKANTICPGKYIVMISGDTGAVKHSVDVGVEHAADKLVNHIYIPNIHPDVMLAMDPHTKIKKEGAIGMMEFFNVAAGIEAADTAAKSGLVKVVGLKLAFAIGGKSIVTLTGDVSSVTAAIEASSRQANDKGISMNQVIIPSPADVIFDKLK